MPYIQGENRNHLTLTPICPDDYIEPDSICRAIAAYVSSLDMADLGFKYAETKDTGRPPHDPASMLMLYLYGYLNCVRSSRRLEAETRRNVEVMWQGHFRVNQAKMHDGETDAGRQNDLQLPQGQPCRAEKGLPRVQSEEFCLVHAKFHGATVKDCMAKSL
jgi:hypothetical protein